MSARPAGDLRKVYRCSGNITISRDRMFMMLYDEQNRGTTVDKRRSSRIENLRVRVNRLTLMRHDEIMRVYSNAVLNRNMSPLPRRRRRRTRSSRRRRPVTAPPGKPSARNPSTRSPSPLIFPLKVAHINIEPNTTVIDMVPTSPESDPDTDDDEEDEENEDNIIYPEGVTNFRPYKTVARYRKANNESTNFRDHPLLVDENSTETLILGLEAFAQQHGCDLSFTGKEQPYNKSIYYAAAGKVDLGSVHLLATDGLLTANFQFEIDLDYDSEITQSKDNVKKFVFEFCDAISKVLSCPNNNVRVFSIDKLTKKSARSHVNFGLTTADQKTTEQLARNLQTYARSGFATDTILKHVKPKEYECTWKPVLKHLQIQPIDLDPEHNYDYRRPSVPEQLSRGKRPYYLPIGWYRHALNVKNKYKDDPVWLGYVDADGEWPVAFHGTNAGAVSGIVQHGLLPSAAKRDVVIDEAITQIGKEVDRPGLYVATHCNYGSYPQYTTAFTVNSFPDKSEQFSIVFQCRVQPGKFTTHKSPVSKGEAWRIVDPTAVRPYGILLKKEDPTQPEEET